MNLVVSLVLFGVLISIVVQDFRDREVSVMLFAFMFLSIVLRSLLYVHILHLIESAAINLFICGILLLCAKVFFLCRDKENDRLLEKYIGKGDLIIMAILAFSFSSLNFILFLLVSFVLAIIHGLIQFVFCKRKNLTIPLAGHLAGTYSIIMALGFFFTEIDFYEEYLILGIFC